MRAASAAAGVGALIASSALHAQVFLLQTNQDLIGQPGQALAEQKDTLPDIARSNHLGFDEIVAANPGVDTWLPGAGRTVRLPTVHLLPNVPRTGIVVNLPDGRLYYFRTDEHQQSVVEVHPISVGQMDWKTPIGVTKIVQKEKNPTWYPPKSVRDKHLQEGDVLPPSIPPGPDNPLGEFALRLGIPGGSYLIHGTNNPIGVGMQITHGCIRLYPEDIAHLFGEVAVGMDVRIVNQRIKTGWVDGALYLEVHHPLEAVMIKDVEDPTALTRALVAATQAQRVKIDWDTAERVFEQADGTPTRISN